MQTVENIGKVFKTLYWIFAVIAGIIGTIMTFIYYMDIRRVFGIESKPKKRKVKKTDPKDYVAKRRFNKVVKERD